MKIAAIAFIIFLAIAMISGLIVIVTYADRIEGPQFNNGYINRVFIAYTTAGGASYIAVLPTPTSNLSIPFNSTVTKISVEIFVNNSFAAASTYNAQYLTNTSVTIYNSTSTLAIIRPTVVENCCASIGSFWTFNKSASNLNIKILGTVYINATLDLYKGRPFFSNTSTATITVNGTSVTIYTLETAQSASGIVVATNEYSSAYNLDFSIIADLYALHPDNTAVRLGTASVGASKVVEREAWINISTVGQLIPGGSRLYLVLIVRDTADRLVLRFATTTAVTEDPGYTQPQALTIYVRYVISQRYVSTDGLYYYRPQVYVGGTNGVRIECILLGKPEPGGNTADSWISMLIADPIWRFAETWIVGTAMQIWRLVESFTSGIAVQAWRSVESWLTNLYLPQQAVPLAQQLEIKINISESTKWLLLGAGAMVLLVVLFALTSSGARKR